MNSIHFVIQTLPGTPEQLNDRLREVSEKVNKAGFEPLRVFEQMKVTVKEVVFGPNHIGVLSEDGKAYRVPFSINSDRLDFTKSDSSKNGSSSVKNSAPSSSRQLARSRARLMRTTARSGSGGQNSGSRSTGVIIAGSSSNRPLVTVAAPFVPEELISQAEVVLQGKSRNLIIRELQRTNLDVNLAVNNLLSRDDEEVEDNEESADSYVPEDLISLLDNGFHGDNNSVIIDPADGLFSEEIFSNYSSIRNLLFDRIRSERNQPNASNSDGNQSRLSGSNGGGLSGTNTLSTQGLADREAFSRWRDRQCYNPRRWINKEEMVWEKEAGDTKTKESSTKNSPIWISDELQTWPEKTNSIRFKKIAALYSEFVALSESGDLHQWKWTEAEPYKSEICDNNMLIRAVDARYPGSSHDSFVWNISSGRQFFLRQYEAGDRANRLLGDCGYGIEPFLLTPYRDPPYNSREYKFNMAHSSARNIVERTIGVLKSRFRCLMRALHYSPYKTVQIINACCALHNICRTYNIEHTEDGVQSPETESDVGSFSTLALQSEGQRIRNEIADSLM